MGKGPNKKRNKTTKRGKGCYQSTDDGEEQPPSIGRRCQKSNKRRDNNQQQKNGNYNRGDNDYDTDDCKKLRKTLNADGLEIVEMSADGNCLFRSLSDQLFGDYGKMHYDVRAVVCDFMEQNKADFQVFLVFEDEDDEDQCEEDARDFDHYVGNMREQGQWGGNLEVVAAARLYRRSITVYSETMAAFTIDHGESKSMGPDLLVSYHDNDHYNSVRNKLHPPKLVRNGMLPMNDILSNKIHTKNTNIYETTHQGSHEIECITTSFSALPLSDKREEETEKNTIKNVKRNAPCPCGSGLRYKKCCLARQKHATRVERLRVKRQDEEESLPAETEEERSHGMFRVVAI